MSERNQIPFLDLITPHEHYCIAKVDQEDEGMRFCEWVRRSYRRRSSSITFAGSTVFARTCSTVGLVTMGIPLTLLIYCIRPSNANRQTVRGDIAHEAGRATQRCRF